MPVPSKQEFKTLFDQHFKPLRNYLYYRCGDAELATDIAQDTFLKVWEKQLDIYPNRAMGLLVKIANDLFLSSHRRMKNGQKFQMSIEINHNNTTPEDELNYNELQRKYESALNDLNNNQRVVFLMSRHEGLKNQEIADQLGIGLKAVEKRMTQAIAFFKNRLL